MLIVNPDGLFRGDRLAMCSKTAWLYWTPIFLCANGYGRFEVNHGRVAPQIGARCRPLGIDKGASTSPAYGLPIAPRGMH